MQRLIGPLSLLFVATGLLQAADWTGNVSLALGNKQLDNDDWGDDGDSHFLAGVALDFAPERWPVNVVIDFYRSSTDDEDEFSSVEVGTNEIAIGVRKYFSSDVVQPHIGGGLSFLTADWEVQTSIFGGTTTFDDTSETAVGFWLGGGVNFIIAEHFLLGAQLRYGMADVEFDEEEFDEVDAGGLSFMGNIGFHW